MTERPKSRLPDGRINPEYTAWRKANKAEAAPEPESVAENQPPGEVDSDAGSSPAPATFQEEAPSIVIEVGIAGVDDVDDSEDIPTFTLGDGAAIEESPETLSLMVIREARNSKFVLCALDKKKVAVRLLKKGTGPKLIKKHIKVQCVRKNYIQVP